MRRGLIIALVVGAVLAVLCGGAGALLWPAIRDNARDSAYLSECDATVALGYRALFPVDFVGDRNKTIQHTRDVLSRRLREMGIRKVNAVRMGDEVVLSFPVRRERLAVIRDALAQIGLLELRAVAPRDVHERYLASGQVPDGHEALAPPDQVGSDRPWIQKQMLLEKSVVVTGADMMRVELDQGFQQGRVAWSVLWELTPAAAIQFDAKAAELYGQEPKGMIAIVLNGRIHSAPVLMVPSLHGHGLISGGFDEQGARALAAILKSGTLPVPIGAIDDQGVARPGVPQQESFVPK